MMEPHELPNAIGEKPDLSVLLMPLTDVDFVHQAGYVASMSKKATVGELRAAMRGFLSPDAAEMLTSLMWQGRDLEDEFSLKDNNVNLPGPAARKAGEKLKLYFDLKRDILDIKRKEAAEAERLAKLEQERIVEQRRQEELRRIEAEMERLKQLQEQHGLIDWVEKHIGFSRAKLAEVRGVRLREDTNFADPKHHLEVCTEEQICALESLMQGTHGHRLKIYSAFRNDNPSLREHYDRSKVRMLSARTPFTRHNTPVMQALQAEPEKFSCLGNYDASINEFPLWHGTPTTSGAHGICESGFDINFVGSTTDYGWYGPGFYFSDNCSVSVGYSRQGHHINRRFPSIQIMLLNRVVVGNVRIQERINGNDERARERLTAECLGPGGVFGPSSPFHTLLGQGNEYVCMSSHQVYPEYVIVYSTQ